ncbi:hypothetical protein [Streptomyces sp. CBMA29]|uniref:hypothetical protein n=1 Tax=Streptomyces sp. CBMA29 TaxID=1896314 RepID=UPI001661AFAF|nr:hypothetical protein [Streptomyces sp. CBMA29]MBD0734073.1 hypothetical protein [Streptomyces sp. CBMA29]
MTALYPVSVHTYTAHRDAVEYVLADHVNSLQDEVTAIEQAVGANPNTWTYTGDANFSNLGDLAAHTTWNSVKDRLDSLQAHVVRLERRQPPAVTTLPGQVPGGVRLPPVLQVRNSGQLIPQSAVRWSTYDLSTADFDSDSIFTGGSSVVCPRTGWWNITASTWTDVPTGNSTVLHSATNRILVAGTEVAAHTSSLPLGSANPHRVNLLYSGSWSQGDPLLVQSQQGPTPDSGSVWSQMRLSVTFVRETV